MRTLLLVICLLFTACDSVEVEVVDETMMVDDEGNYIPPCLVPWQLRIDDSVLDPDYGFDPILVENMSNWWNERGEEEWFIYTDACEDEELPCIDVSSGFTGTPLYDETEAYGVFFYEIENGCVTTGSIFVSSDIAYDEETVQWVLYHEGGHALSLLDDPYSLDLNSIMSIRYLPYSDVTAQDLFVLHENLIVFER